MRDVKPALEAVKLSPLKIKPLTHRGEILALGRKQLCPSHFQGADGWFGPFS